MTGDARLQVGGGPGGFFGSTAKVRKSSAQPFSRSAANLRCFGVVALWNLAPNSQPYRFRRSCASRIAGFGDCCTWSASTLYHLLLFRNISMHNLLGIL